MSDSKIEAARSEAERKSWDALARYKFWMFGYHAAQWVNLNRLATRRQMNPFVALVRHARGVKEHGAVAQVSPASLQTKGGA